MAPGKEARVSRLAAVPRAVDLAEASRHDAANVLVLGVLNAYNLSLWKGAAGSHWRGLLWGGLTDPGAWRACFRDGHGAAILVAIIVYLSLDSVYLALRPRAVQDVCTVLIHHVVCVVAVATCLLDLELGFLVSATAWVEVNTWSLTVRRLLKQGAGRGKGGGVGDVHAAATLTNNVLFYASWVLTRLVFTPSLLVVALRTLAACRPRHPLWPLAPALAPVAAGCGLCWLNLMWTRNLLASAAGGRRSPPPRNKLYL